MSLNRASFAAAVFAAAMSFVLAAVNAEAKPHLGLDENKASTSAAKEGEPQGIKVAHRRRRGGLHSLF